MLKLLFLYILYKISIMSSNSELPFSQVKTLRCIGVDQRNPFCSIICEGKVIYTSGANIIMQNTKTNDQKILFNNTFEGQITLIHHEVTLYHEHLLTITINDTSQLSHIIVIINLNSIILGEREPKDKTVVHVLKDIEEFQEIKSITFFDEGNSFGVVSSFQNLDNFTLMKTKSGEVLYQQSFINTNVLVKSLHLNKVNCACILQDGGEGGIKICLMALEEIGRRYYFTAQLQSGERIMEYHYEGHQDESIILALTNRGYVLIYKINQYEVIQLNRIDVRKQKNGFRNQKGAKRCSSLLQQEYLQPILIQPAGNKIIITYQSSSTLGILFYSYYNPKNIKFSFIEQALANFPLAKSIKSIRIAKDNCSLAALIQIDPLQVTFRESTLQISQPTGQQVATPPLFGQISYLPTQLCISAAQMGKVEKERHFIALQIDILSNIINHPEQAFSTDKTFSLFSGHDEVMRVQYCSYNNTMFLLMKNRMLKYYDLSPRQATNPLNKMTLYKQFKVNGLLLWEKRLASPPHFMAIHPFNFTIILIYDEIIKFHYYNSKNIFPAFIITNIQKCSIAKYSPLGDRLVLGTNGAVIILNSYTFEVMKTVSLPNIFPQSQLKRGSYRKEAAPINSKAITDCIFLKNGDLLIFSGSNTFTLILNSQKSTHFGFLQQNNKQNCPEIVYDCINNLVILLQEEDILILARSNINTKNKCQAVSKIEIRASSAYLHADLGVLFIGGRNGVLHMLKWPDYCQQQVHRRKTVQFHQFTEPIVSINVSANLKYIYSVSKSGSFCISELEVDCQHQKLSKDIQVLLLKITELPLKQGDRWLISRWDQQRKERDIIKLRGQEADKVNSLSQLIKRQEEILEERIRGQKEAFEEQYIRELKQYQNLLGLQKMVQSANMLKDQLRICQKKNKRVLQQLTEEKQQKLKQIFYQRTQLQKQFAHLSQQNQRNVDRMKEQVKKQIEQQAVDLRLSQQQRDKAKEEALKKEKKIQLDTKSNVSHLEEDFAQKLALCKMEHQESVCELLDTNQIILSKNRNKNIAIHTFQDKMGELNQEKQKLEFDMYKIQNERSKYSQIKEELVQQLQGNKKIYDRLIKVSKQLQYKVIKGRIKQKNGQYRVDILEQEVKKLCQYESKLQKQQKKVNSDYIQEREMNSIKEASIKDLNIKLQTLKDSKKTKLYQIGFIKNNYLQLIKSIMRNLQVDQVKAARQVCEMYRTPNHSEIKESVNSSQYQLLKSQHQKLANDASKWKEIKQSYMNSYFRNHKKLDQQNLKLTYRYNDLLRLSQQYKVHISYLRQEISKLERQAAERKSLPRVIETKQQARLKYNFSFLNKQEKPKQSRTKLKKKLICLSLHQQSGKFITQT